MQRFVEEIDFLRVLHKAELVEFEGAETPAASQSTKDTQTRLPEVSELINTVKPVPGAEDCLSSILAAQQFIFLYSSVAVEDGFQVHVVNNHLPYLLMFFVGHVFWGAFLAIGVEPTTLEGVLRILFSLITCPIVALLLTRGSPLQLKSQKTRANLHEIHANLLAVPTLLSLAMAYDTVSQCSGIDGKLACLHIVTAQVAANFSLAPLIVPRLILVVPVYAGFLVVANIIVWVSRDPFVPINFYVSQMLTMHVCVFMFSAVLVVRDRMLRKSYQANLRLALKRAEVAAALRRGDGVMQFLLPPSVLRSIVEGKSVFHTAQATVIQADLCNFTLWCSTRTSSQVVDMLSVVMSAFDQLAVKHEVTRIKVLGDGYIAVCGLPDDDTKHAEKGLRFALGLQVELTRSTMPHPEWGEMLVRTGVHSGEVSAGVLSQQRWAYDIYGDTPAIAGVLEPRAINGGVLVSKATVSLLPRDMQKGVEQLGPGPVFNMDGAPLGTCMIDVRFSTVDLVVDDLDSAIAPSESGSQQPPHANARALLIRRGAAGSDEIAAPILLQRGTSSRQMMMNRVIEDTIPDPAPEIYEGFTRVAASTLVALSAVVFLGSSIEQGQPSAAVFAVLALFILSLINVLVPPALVQRHTTIILAFLGAVFVSPYIATADRSVTIPTVITMGLSCLTYLHYAPSWLFYVVLWSCYLLNVAMLTILAGEFETDEAVRYILLVTLLSFLRVIHSSDMEELTLATAQRNEEITKKWEEKEVLEMVLRLKMPAHVVDRLFTEERGDVLNTSYVINSCHIAFCKFELPSSEAPKLEMLKLLTTLIDRTLPSDGSGKLRYLEKIKTIGDVVMLGGSLVPAVAEEVSEEEVLLELLHFVVELDAVMGEMSINVKCFIGVDKGEVTTATVGNVNLEYDVFGTTVNTAARVMATLIKGCAKIQEEKVEGLPEIEQSIASTNQRIAVRCTERVIPGLTRLQYLAQNAAYHPHLSREDLNAAPSYEAVNETYIFAKGIGQLKAYMLTPRHVQLKKLL